jgi:4-amino-4-deoxy-L-arabinose transferase-like glycosyltransferase
MIRQELPPTELQELQKSDHDIYAALLAIATLYAILAMILDRVGAFWSPDNGARFAMIKNWILHGSFIHWYYPYRKIDPTGQIHPLSFFLFHTQDTFYPQYEPLFPVLCAPFYRLFGFFGLTIIPILSGLGTVWLIYATARRLALRSAAAIAIAAGLGTPILVYSVVFWDHIVMMLITAAAMYCILQAVQEKNARWAAGAGAALGLGVFIHELLLAMFIAMFLASLPLAFTSDGRRLILGFMAGFVPLILLWLGTNQLLYGSFGGPHIDANMGGNPNNHPFSLATLLNPVGFAERAIGELTGIPSPGLMLFGTHTDLLPLFVVLGYALIGYWMIASFLGVASRFGLALSVGISILACYLIYQVHWAHGLFLATPLIIPALSAQWVATPLRNQHEAPMLEALPADSLFYAWMSRAMWLFLFGAILNPMLPGEDWGSRYLLPILPVMVVLAGYALQSQYEACKGYWRKAALAGIAVIFGVSVYSQAEGLTMIRKNMVYNRAVNQLILQQTMQAVVYSDIGMGAEASAVSLKQPQFIASSPSDWQLLLKAFRQSDIQNFTLIGADPIGFDDLTASQTGGLKLKQLGSQQFNPDPATEDGGNLSLTQYALVRQEVDHGSRR